MPFIGQTPLRRFTGGCRSRMRTSLATGRSGCSLRANWLRSHRIEGDPEESSCAFTAERAFLRFEYAADLAVYGDRHLSHAGKLLERPGDLLVDEAHPQRAPSVCSE